MSYTSKQSYFAEISQKHSKELRLTVNIVTRNGKIIWKHGPNCPFNALTSRTKFFYKPFFLAIHQNVNKPKSRAARADYGSIFLHFYVVIIIFYFFCQNASITGSNCAIIGCNLSRKHKLAIKHRAESQTT